MSMRLWSSRILCTAVLVFIAGFLHAQPSAYMKPLPTAYLKSLPKDTVKVTDGRAKDKRLHIKYKGVNRIIPTMAIAQFAGNMGLVSVGVSWDHGARGQWETALLAGFLPREEGRKRYITATLKETYTPWSIQVNDRFSFEPLTCGLYFNSILSRDFWVKEPDHYPSSYYGFSTKIRANVFIGESFTFYTARSGSLLRYASLFYEFGTADMYVISKATNKYLKFWDIFGVSFGVKVKLI